MPFTSEYKWRGTRNNIPEITVAYTNFWSDSYNDLYFKKFISYHFGPVRVVKAQEEPDLLFASCFGPIKNAMNSNANSKIFFYGENLNRRPPYNDDAVINKIFNLAIGFKPTDLRGSKHLHFPLWMTYFPFYDASPDNNLIIALRNLRSHNMRIEKNMLATLVARHDMNGVRKRICMAFANHGKVHAPGPFFNNVPAIKPGIESKIDFISKSIFNICPENSEFEGYHTEKIFQALEAGTIPVYWGVGPAEPLIINPKCYIFHDGSNRSDQKIKEAILDPCKLLNMLNTDPFKSSAFDKIKTDYDNLRDCLGYLLYSEK